MIFGGLDRKGLVARSFFIFFLVSFLAGCASWPDKLENHYARKLTKLSLEHRQAIVVTPMEASDAVVSAWEKKDGAWSQVFDPMPATVGRNGIAPSGKKREGDGRTPSGIYDLKLAFGYAASLETKLNYRQATVDDIWVDDVHSDQYNRWVNGSTNAASFEQMRRKDDLYKMGAVIEYNTGPVIPGHGSAIFLHIWKGPHQPTSGCVALDEDDVGDLLQWLDVTKSPVIWIQTRLESL